MRVLDARRDAAAWRHILNGLPTSLQDVYFSPEYVSLGVTRPEQRALLFVFEHGEHVWIYPFLISKVTHVGGRSLEETWFDVETPYGYGGPISNTDDPTFLGAAHESFTTWCQENGVVAEFVRLHPLLGNQRWLNPQVELILDRETVSLDLTRNWGSKPAFSKEACYMLRRAEREGASVASHPSAAMIEKFARLYRQTMQRRLADTDYFFSDEYFAKLSALTDVSGWLLAVEGAAGWLAAAVFLRGSNLLHYHLSASDISNSTPGVTNLLISHAAHLGRQAGLLRLHLGGGRTSTPDDSLLKFKRSMATDCHSYFIGKRIHQPGVYARLRMRWRNEHPELVERFGSRLLCYRY